MPWAMALGALLPTVLGIGQQLFAAHDNKKNTEKLMESSQQSQAQFAQMMAPYLQSNQQGLAAAQMAAFGGSAQSMGVGAGGPGGGAGPYPANLGFRGYT